MAKNLANNGFYEDEIDIHEIIKLLIESKKLIILTILFFTIASIIYSLTFKPEFKSSSIIEIGHYEMPDGTLELIEDASYTISSIKLDLLKKRDDFILQNLKITSPENKLIKLQLTSQSSKKNVDLLSEINNYIDERHSKLALLVNEQKKKEISNKIELIDSEISFHRTKNLSKIKDRIAKLNAELPIIDLEISQLEKVISDDTNNLSIIKSSTAVRLERASAYPTLEQVIFNYKSKINNLNTKKHSNIIEKQSLENELQSLNNSPSQFDEIFKLEQKQKILENELQTLISLTLEKSRPIGNIQTKTIKPKTQSIVFLGIILGFFTSFLLLFILNFVKSYRESHA